MEPGVIIVVLVALVFDYTNGFHDAANSIATVVATRVLSPRRAVAWAAFFNFAAFLVFGTEVATTIAKDVVDPLRNVLTVGVVFAGLIGAIGWNLTTFYLGLPTSSSHALVGGMAGAAVARGGFGVLQEEGLRKIGVFIVLSPLIGLALGLIFTLVIMRTFHRVRRVDTLNAVLPAGSAALGGGVQPRPRRERRPEDDGRDPGRPHRFRTPFRRRRRAAVGRARRPHGHRSRDA